MNSVGAINKIKNRFKSSKKLRDIIRDVRSCKTAAEERAYVQKECAVIRDFFRDENSVYRCRNVAKLLYFYMLGYPAHFGQMECLKLIVSENFGDKRVGYLGIMLLLDDKQDVQLLITHSLKNDLINPSPYIIGMAITALANICSADVTRDIAPMVDDLMRSSDPYIRKKAALCAVRMVKVVPEMVDIFHASVFPLLEEKNHGVQLAGTSLMIEILKTSKKYENLYKPCTTLLVRNLSALVRSGSYATDYQIGGITDPFLQTKIIEALRILGRKNRVASEKMYDVLTEVLTHTESTSNIGNAVLYEAVTTVIDIEVDTNLRVLAINILGRFLVNSDSNIKYIALNSLLSVVTVDYNAVQRHRSVILDSLKDGGEIIKRRAMELSFTLINKLTVKSIVKELVAFMNTNNHQLKSDCASGIILVSERHATDKVWYFNTVTEVLSKAGDYVRDDVVSSFIQMLSEAKDLQIYATYILFMEATGKTKNFQNENSSVVITCYNPLLKITAWTIGEYGDLLLSEQSELISRIQKTSTESCKLIKEWHMVKFIEKCLSSSQVSFSTKNFVLTAALKLTSRLSTSEESKLTNCINLFKKSYNIELQQRSMEYDKIVYEYNDIKNDLLERLPPIERDVENGTSNNNIVENDAHDEQTNNDNLLDVDYNYKSTETPIKTLPDKADELINLFETSQEKKDEKVVENDILSLFKTEPTIAQFDSNKPQVSSNIFDMFDIPAIENNLSKVNNFDIFSSAPNPIPPGSTQVFKDENGLTVHFFIENRWHVMYKLVISMQNSSDVDFDSVNLKIAVPKTFSVDLDEPDGTNLSKNNQNVIKQTAKINNPEKKTVRVRIRLTYIKSLEQFTRQFDFDQF